MALLNPDNLLKMQANRRRFHAMHKTVPKASQEARQAPVIEKLEEVATSERKTAKLIKMPPYEFYVHFEDRLKSN